MKSGTRMFVPSRCARAGVAAVAALGGTYSVRGFNERETAGDNGVQASLELFTPKLGTPVQPLLFLDLGRRHLETTVEGQSAGDNIASIGAGLRWQWARRLDVYADLAHVLKGLHGGTQSGDNRLHFGLLYRF